MRRTVSRVAIVFALLKKELVAYARDTVYLALTLVVLIAAPLLFRAMPDRVDEELVLAICPPVERLLEGSTEALRALGASEADIARIRQADLTNQKGLLLVEFDDAAKMRAAIEGSLEVWRASDGTLVFVDTTAGEKRPRGAERVDVQVGVAFPERFLADLVAGARGIEVTVYTHASAPPELRQAVTSFVREAAFEIAGDELPVRFPDEKDVVLGTDRLGDQVSLREKMRPMLLFVVLMMETFSMASLVSTEVLERTVTAVLVTPAKVSDFIAAKTIFGTLVSFTQALIVLALIGGLTASSWSVVLAVLAIGAVMFTGIALIVGAAGKDFIGQLFYAMLFTVPLLIPAFAVLFPGSVAPWVRVLPTFPIIDVLVKATVYGGGWREAAGSLVYALAWLAVLFGAGVVALRRKVASL
ncbi:ABC transporter permease [Coriobacteriia bacterium Es71-Z0120]|uniref:ABC transporter permease n=1 Tax=Parvivirga hydrogeniphila TaxID=2939460 RepID=UPI002260CD83|nr:ABC transporter permease [Parvivirga hydrogeniphila]MCL4078027.1 ABC transporter permease [Parvivirga hydrogeniphila]